MTQFLSIHLQNPQPRLIQQAIDVLKSGGIIVYPTDSCYALGCHIGDKTAMERIAAIRHLPKDAHFTLICRDLSEIATYAKVDNAAFRLMKSLTPGAYTFILKATNEVPRRLQHPKRKTIGIRVPEHTVVNSLLAALHEPILSTTLLLPEQTLPETEPEEIYNLLKNKVDLIIDGGNCGVELTTIIDLTDEIPQIIRYGKGQVNF